MATSTDTSIARRTVIGPSTWPAGLGSAVAPAGPGPPRFRSGPAARRVPLGVDRATLSLGRGHLDSLMAMTHPATGLPADDIT